MYSPLPQPQGVRLDNAQYLGTRIISNDECRTRHDESNSKQRQQHHLHSESTWSMNLRW